MPNLAAVDWMIALIYFFFVISVGLSLRQFIVGSGDFMLAGRGLPAWLCGFAFVGASLGSVELLGMGAAGASYGFASASFFSLGSILPLLFAGLYMMPVYYASKARSVPGYIGLRFDGKTRTLNALLFLATGILYSAISLYVMARIAAALGIFDVLFHAQTVGSQGVLLVSIALPAALVLVYVSLGGLASTMYAQVMQFFILVAAFLPMVLLGLKQVGGWSGLRSSFAAAAAHLPGGAPANGAAALALATGFGVVLTAGYWCTDFSMLQTAMAAKNERDARRAPLIAAAARVFIPFLLTVPGLIAICLPTPHTTVVMHSQNGTIFHEINVVPHAAEEGQGLVPARTDSPAGPAAGKIVRDPQGHPLLDYEMATANLLPYNLPTGLIGLAITALLACLTGGIAARISAISTVFTCDLYEPYFRKSAPEKDTPAVARWTTLGAVVVSAALAALSLRVHNMPGLLDLLAISFAIFYAPMLPMFLLGMFWKRTTAQGAFFGLLAGFAAALAHYGLTLPIGSTRGIAGGWIAPLHYAPGILAQNVGTALCGILASLIVTVAVSLFTAARPEVELAGLVYSLTPAAPERPGLFSPAVFAGTVLVAAIAVTLIFL